MKKAIIILAAASMGRPASGATVLYQAQLTPEAVIPGPGDDDPSGISTASGRADFTLTTGGTGGPTLAYSLTFDGLEVSENVPRPTLTGPDTLIRAIHIHFGAIGATGGHALNIYGFPREDDGDLVVSSIDSMVGGLWDDGDENLGIDGILGMGDSVALSQAIDALQAGELYLQVHTMGFRAGELRGQITAVPEPTSSAVILTTLVLGCLRRQRPALAQQSD